MKQIRIWQQWPPGWTPTFEIVPLEPPTYALVDDEDYEWLSQYQWFVILDGGKQLPRGSDGQKRWYYPSPRCIITPADTFIGGVGAHTEQMNRMIMDKLSGLDGRQVTYRDGNRLNNQRENLAWRGSKRRSPTQTKELPTEEGRGIAKERTG